jgi:hypothetical protein
MPFPVSCPACGKSFSIADDAYEQKIKGRVVSVKCKQCQTLIRVDGTRESGAAAGASSRSNPPANPGPAFLVDTPGSTDRELTGAQIAAEMLAGRMTEATLVWREGMEEWTEAGKVKELASFLKAPASAPATESARPPRIRPMQPTLPMGMMAPPSLAARGLGLPLTPPAPARGDDTEASKPPADEGRELVGDSLPQLDSMPPEADRQPPVQPPRADALSGSPARPASAPRAAARPASAPRASAVPIPTPMPRPAPASSPLTTAAAIGVAEEPSHPGNHAMKPAAPVYSAFPAQGVPFTSSSAPTAPAPPGLMPQQSLAPLPPNLVPSLPSSVPPLPASFPATASIENLDFRPKRKRVIVVAVLVGIAVIGIGLVAASGGGTPAPVPVPVPPAVPTAEPPSPSPSPSPTPASNSPAATPGTDPLRAPTTPPKTGNEFTDLFAAGAKKLGSAKPTTSATPPPTQ